MTCKAFECGALYLIFSNTLIAQSVMLELAIPDQGLAACLANIRFEMAINVIVSILHWYCLTTNVARVLRFFNTLDFEIHLGFWRFNCIQNVFWFG